MKHTNAATLAKLTGFSRERIGKLLQRGDIEAEYEVTAGGATRWTIPVKAAEQWLRGHGIRVHGWARHPHRKRLWVGRMTSP